MGSRQGQKGLDQHALPTAVHVCVRAYPEFPLFGLLPLLSFFSFDRLVIDEFTYLMPDQLAGIRTITASSRWILSGTPPLKDFGELKTCVTFLALPAFLLAF